MERFLVKKEPKPKAMTVTAQALEKRRAVALPSKLVPTVPSHCRLLRYGNSSGLAELLPPG